MTNFIPLELFRCWESSTQAKPFFCADRHHESHISSLISLKKRMRRGIHRSFDAPGRIAPGVNFQRLIQITDTRFIGISEMDDIEIAVNKKGPGIDRLDRH